MAEESKDYDDAFAKLQSAIEMADKAAADLNILGYEVHITGWTKPCERGSIRMQGNSRVRLEKREET